MYIVVFQYVSHCVSTYERKVDVCQSSQFSFDIFTACHLLPYWPRRDVVTVNNFKSIISEHILRIKFAGTSCEMAICWTSPNTFYKSTLVHVMAWCCKVKSRYLSQCWFRSNSPYGVTKPQWVKPYARNKGQMNAFFTHFNQHIFNTLQWRHN